ncbi:hypothetical protein JM16_004505 [Phytophthora kernoviae]|uniref:EF-hand domain-containing protein n=1 Tax=Phytophthora kernoviae TaxID=325452 RepID=A0A8T0LZV7_9STRA|nr:hypothetical protein JM16_004505 [Phytophthora kernoviae]
MPQPTINAATANEEHSPLQLNLIPRLTRKQSHREMPAAIKAPPLTPVRVEPLRWSTASFSLSFLTNIDRLEINETVDRDGVVYYVLEVYQFHYNSRLPTNVNNPRMASTMRLSDASESREPDFKVERRFSDFSKLRRQVKLWSCPNSQFTCPYCYEYSRYMRFKLRQPRLYVKLTANVEKRKGILVEFLTDFIDLAQNPSKNTVHRCEAHQHEGKGASSENLPKRLNLFKHNQRGLLLLARTGRLTHGGSLFEVGENVEFWRVLVHLSILAFCLVLFEKGLHRLEHKFPPSEKYQHMLKKVYRELMVLGLLGLGLKILKENPDIDSYSKTMIAFQVADLTIFFLALALILQSTAIFLLLRHQNNRADRAELITTQDLANGINSPEGHGQYEATFFHKLFCCGRAAKSKAIEKELIELRLLRRLFLRRFGLPQLFPFSKYLSRAQANQISHMIEVEPSMWLLLLAVAWAICGVLDLLDELDTEMGTEVSESHELVESFMLFAWIVLFLHVTVMLYFRTCVHKLLWAAAYSDDKRVLATNLSVIAEEEANAWRNEEADTALEVMSRIQEHHEEIEYHRIQGRSKLAKNDAGVQLVVDSVRTAKAANKALKIGRDSLSGVQPGSPDLQLSFFSHKVWHVAVMFLLILNGFLITLFVQCAVYDMDDIYGDFGMIPTAMVPLPLLLNALVFQRRIFYDFVIVSNILRIDAHTLSDVVENFSEVVRLRSEFATSLIKHLAQQELGADDLKNELKARDMTTSGFIELDDLRSVLSKFGFCLTRFRFNSVVKLLFELEGTQVAYAQVVRLVVMAQNEHLIENLQDLHPLLRPSLMPYDELGQPSVQSNYSLYASTQHVPLLAQPSAGTEPCPDDFVNVPGGSFVLPVLSQRGINPITTATQQQQALRRPSVSSQALHGMFNLQGLSGTHGGNSIVQL